MSDDKFLALKKAYQDWKDGSGSEEEFKKAFRELNGPSIEGETEYFLLMAGGRLIRLNDRVTVFTSESTGRIFSIFCRGGDCLGRVTKSKLLKQLDPGLKIVLDPGTSPITAPGKAMTLSELPDCWMRYYGTAFCEKCPVGKLCAESKAWDDI